MTNLPNGVDKIVQFLADKAEGYNNVLKWNEVAMFKADLMNVPERWHAIDPAAFRAACVDAGMRAVDADELTDYLRRRKQGKRLVPVRSYRSHKFAYPVKVLNSPGIREW